MNDAKRLIDEATREFPALVEHFEHVLQVEEFVEAAGLDLLGWQRQVLRRSLADLDRRGGGT